MATGHASNAQAWSGSGWRAVEAQHQVATMGLVAGSLPKQALLEAILDESKPLLPENAQGLHWLLSTPFRYWPLPGGSRFRRREDPGVFYGAVEREVACAECGYWRYRFWMDSEFLQDKTKSVDITLFEFHAQAGSSIDLRKPPYVQDRQVWRDPASYTATQALADEVRQEAIGVIHYESARLEGGHCLAIMTPEAFKQVAEPYRENIQNWMLTIVPGTGVVWQRNLSVEKYDFHMTGNDNLWNISARAE